MEHCCKPAIILHVLLALSVTFIKAQIELPDEQRTSNQVVEAKACCHDVLSPILRKEKKCQNGLKPTLNCSSGSSAFLFNDMDESGGFLSVNDTSGILTAQFHELSIDVPHNQYCVGHLESDNSSLHNVAIVCMPHFDETTVSALEVTIYANLEFLSSIFLIVTTIIYVRLKELRDLQGMCILNFITNLSLTYIILGILQYVGHFQPYAICVFKAYALYFFSLCAFFWLNISSFNLWKNTTGWNTDERKTLNTYVIAGYGFPTLFLCTAILAQMIDGNHPKPDFGEILCWFKDARSKWYYHYLPMTILLMLNVIYFVDSGRRLWKIHHSRQRPLSRVKCLRYKFLLYLKLFLIMGITWPFEVLSATVLEEDTIIVYITDVINCLQGLIIFIILVATRKRVIRLLARRGLCNINCFPYSSWSNTSHDNEETEEEHAQEFQVQFQNVSFGS